MTYNKRLYTISILSIISLIVGIKVSSSIGIGGYLDIPSLLFIVIAFYMLYFIPQLLSHEIDKGLTVALILVSYIAALILFVITFFKQATKDTNRYGAKPLSEIR